MCCRHVALMETFGRAALLSLRVSNLTLNRGAAWDVSAPSSVAPSKKKKKNLKCSCASGFIHRNKIKMRPNK